MEHRLQCVESKQVRYSYPKPPELFLELNIPVEAAANVAAVSAYNERKQKKQRLVEEGEEEKKGEEEEEVLPVVPFQACLDLFSRPESIPGWFSTALGRHGVASKTVRFQTFPRYLAVQLKR